MLATTTAPTRTAIAAQPALLLINCRSLNRTTPRRYQHSMNQIFTVMASLLLAMPAQAQTLSPSRMAAVIITEVKMLEDEAAYALEVDGNVNAACSIWKAALDSAREASRIYPAESTVNLGNNSFFKLKEHCRHKYPNVNLGG